MGGVRKGGIGKGSCQLRSRANKCFFLYSKNESTVFCSSMNRYLQKSEILNLNILLAGNIN